MTLTYTFTEIRNRIRSADSPAEIGALLFLIQDEIDYYPGPEKRAIYRMMLIKTKALRAQEQKNITRLESIRNRLRGR